MTPTVLAVRAITATYALQLLRPLLLIGLGAYVVVMGIITWIAVEVSPWWLLLGILPTIAIIVGLLLWTIVWVLARRLSPAMNRKQRTATKKFVAHVGRAAEHIGTPKFLLIFQVIKDVVFPSKRGRTFIGEIAQTPGEMKRDFDALRKLF